MRHVLAVVCVLAATTATAAAPAAAAEKSPVSGSAAFAPDPWGPVFTYNYNSAKVMASKNRSKVHGTPMVQWAPSNDAYDNDRLIWEWETTVRNLVRLKPFHTYSNNGNVHDDMCLAVENASMAPNARIVQARCTYDGVNNDVWWADSPSPANPSVGRTQLRNQKSNLCITVLNASTANGAQLVQYPCNGGLNSLWY